jgi:RNA polymerase sigma-70 factor (ECF subfamily)
MENWLEAVYREHAPALYRFLLRLTGNEADTHDVLQEVFVCLARSPQLLEGVAAPRSYLFRMAHRQVIDRHRREETRRRAVERAARETSLEMKPEPSVSDAIWQNKCLATALQSLPLEQKAVVTLKVWENLTFAEIAHVLDIPANTAASRYRYALDKLRDALRPLQEDLP